MVKRVFFITLIIILLDCVVINSIVINGFSSKKNNLKDIINEVNKEYREKYNINFDYYDGNYDVSRTMFEDYNILVCTINGVTQHGNKDKNGEYRYLGYDPYGESIENPNYYYDALDGTSFEKLNWISKPYLNASVTLKYPIDRSHFDHFAPQFRDIFIYGFNYYHGTNGVFGNHLGPNWQDLPWEDYYHIPIAPTKTTRGVAWLFHKESDGSIWYTSAWLPPLSVLELEETKIIDVETSAGNAVIGHNQLNKSIYEVKQSVPTSEPLYIDITTDEYLLNLNINKVSGVHTYTEEVLSGYDNNGDAIYTLVTYYVPYEYYKIDHLEVYGLDHTITQNYALPNGSVTIYPDSERFKTTDLEFNRAGGMIAIDSHVTVWNDKLTINGQVILDDCRVSQYAPSPNNVKIPITQNKALYKEGLVIPATLPNKSLAGSNTMAYYTYVGGTEGAGIKTKNIVTNSLTVHTPIVCNGGIVSDNAFDQSVVVDTSRASVILGRPTKIQLLTKGQHKNITGYGNNEYSKYTHEKQVKFPFDVYINTTVPEKSKFLKSNTWYSVPVEQETTDVFIPTWVNEGNYTIEYRSLAINTLNNSSSENLANLDLKNYIATDTSSIKVVGRLYGFKVTDIENYPLWENVFRAIDNSDQHSNNYYTVGLKDRDGNIQGSNEIFTLPLVNGSHPTVKNEGTIPLGYTFKFECETVGNYFGEKDCIEILPTFYYISSDGKDKKEVDIWYSEYFDSKNHYFVKVGSEEDKKNVKYIKLGDPDRNAPKEYIKNTSLILGMTENAFLEQKAKLGWFNRIILAKPLRLFTGDMEDLPEGVLSTSVKKSVQHWYGEYYLPNLLYAVPKETDVLSYAKTQNGLSKDEDFWLKDGYIVVNFDISTIKNGDFSNPVLSYHQGSRCNMWQVEGYNLQKTDYYGHTFNLTNGDVAFYNLNRHASDDFNTKGTH